MFQEEDDHLLNLDNRQTQHWETILENRLLSVDPNFGYAMFYYYKGIPDDELEECDLILLQRHIICMTKKVKFEPSLPLPDLRQF